jgi:phospholipid/cholesterol/gamma-HCH transport system permease protein
MADEPGWFKATRTGDVLRISAGGVWNIPTLAALDSPLRALTAVGCREVVVDLSGIEHLDTTGAWMLHRTQAHLAGPNVTVSLAGVRPEYAPLLDQIARGERAEMPPELRPGFRARFVMDLGKATIDVVDQALGLLNFFGLLCITLGHSLRRPGRFRFTAIVNHLERTGFDALPIVGLLSFLIGVVIVFQGVDQLRRFGAEIYVVNLLGVSVLREMGILITAIIVAGRSGSAFTAEIGTMKVNEEVDAMLTMGLDPVEVLVLPRIMALVITLPLLVFFADIMGIAGGIAMSMLTLDLNLSQALHQLQSGVSITHFWVGMIKAPVFAFVIAMVGCYEGLNVSHSAESVGRLTTKSVVEAIFLVILLDAAFSVLFANWGL